MAHTATKGGLEANIAGASLLPTQYVPVAAHVICLVVRLDGFQCTPQPPKHAEALCGMRDAPAFHPTADFVSRAGQSHGRDEALGRCGGREGADANPRPPASSS